MDLAGIWCTHTHTHTWTCMHAGSQVWTVGGEGALNNGYPSTVSIHGVSRATTTVTSTTSTRTIGCNGLPDPTPDCDGIGPDDCTQFEELFETCPAHCQSCINSTTTTTVTSTTTVSTTTATCNGLLDPSDCGTVYLRSWCPKINLVGKRAKEKCPIMCDSCIATTSTHTFTSTSATRTSSTVTATSTTSTTTTTTTATATSTTTTTPRQCGPGEYRLQLGEGREFGADDDEWGGMGPGPDMGGDEHVGYEYEEYGDLCQMGHDGQEGATSHEECEAKKTKSGDKACDWQVSPAQYICTGDDDYCFSPGRYIMSTGQLNITSCEANSKCSKAKVQDASGFCSAHNPEVGNDDESGWHPDMLASKACYKVGATNKTACTLAKDKEGKRTCMWNSYGAGNDPAGGGDEGECIDYDKCAEGAKKGKLGCEAAGCKYTESDGFCDVLDFSLIEIGQFPDDEDSCAAASGTWQVFAQCNEKGNTCSPCPDGHFRADAAHTFVACNKHTPCDSREFVEAQPTATSNTVCKSHSDCAKGEYESKPPQAGETDRLCIPLTQCTAKQFIQTPAQMGSTDTQNWVAKTDQVCADCDGSEDSYRGGCIRTTTATATTTTFTGTTTTTTSATSTTTTTATSTSETSTTSTVTSTTATTSTITTTTTATSTTATTSSATVTTTTRTTTTLNAHDLEKAGVSALDLRKMKKSAEELINKGFLTADLVAAGYSESELHASGVSADELKEYFRTSLDPITIILAGVSGFLLLVGVVVLIVCRRKGDIDNHLPTSPTSFENPQYKSNKSSEYEVTVSSFTTNPAFNPPDAIRASTVTEQSVYAACDTAAGESDEEESYQDVQFNNNAVAETYMDVQKESDLEC